MATLFAPSALLPEGWADNVIIEIDKDGWIVGVDAFKPAPGGDAETMSGPVIPGVPNAHSRTFQRVMAGLTERGGGRKESFWNWRETMYRFLSQLTPEDIGAIATQVYIEMLKGGYTSVAEFNYIHHQPDGKAYTETSIVSQSLVRAALDAGISITMLPALYAYGGFGERPPEDGQKRFINSEASFLRILQELSGQYQHHPQVTVGFAHHSLRAVSAEMMRAVNKSCHALLPGAPVHIHVAEQASEVEACLEWSGKRPLAWLLENVSTDKNWCIIHATHIDASEVKQLAQSGAVVALCPTTEANLGGGIFPLTDYFQQGGIFSIGSGSNVTISMQQELRWLEYGQRLQRQERKIIQSLEIPSVGGMLLEQATKGGAQATGRKTGRIEAGYRADLVVLDTDLASMTQKVRDHVLDAAIFAANHNPVKDVMSGGKWVVRDHQHRREEQVLGKYRDVIRKLL